MRLPMRSPAGIGRLLPLALAAGLAGSALAAAGPRAYPVAAGGWIHPLSTELTDLYSGGLLLSGGLGYLWPDAVHGKGDIAVEGRAGWFQTSGHPAARLAESANSKLTEYPVTAEARYIMAGTGLRPFVSAGPALVVVHESFDYSIFGHTTSVEGKRTDWGGVIGAGVEKRAEPVVLRLSLRALFAGGHRMVVRPSGDSFEESATTGLSSITIGLEVSL
jgi:hypothetical protein